MAQPITISTKQFIKTKEVEIDGYTYQVRRMGAGTSLDMSKNMSELQSLKTDFVNLQGKMKVAGSENKQKTLMNEMQELSGKLNRIIGEIEVAYASLFDDGKDGSVALKMVHEVGFENVPAILEQIFGESDA